MNETVSVSRRGFLARTTCLTGAAFLAPVRSFAGQAAGQAQEFKLHYAPHPGMFKAHAGDNVIDQIKFAHDQGFTAWEDNGAGGRPAALQDQIGKTLRSLGMQMGVFVAYASFDEPTFALANKEKREEILSRVRQAVEVAQRVGAKCFTVVPGSVDQQAESGNWNRYGGRRLAPGFQMANVIELLRLCAEILEPHKLTMVLEPLNWYSDHGGVFLRYSDQAYAVCKAVNRPACKILFDIYHQQITEGNLIPNIDRCWDEIGYFQCGDNPGRKEPGTGEINYRNVFRFIHKRSGETGREFIIGMEHGTSGSGESGEKALIQAYREVDVA